jgi:hypothetical protein
LHVSFFKAAKELLSKGLSRDVIILDDIDVEELTQHPNSIEARNLGAISSTTD